MLKRIGAEESGEFKAVASGTLPCGRPVIVNSDGTVSVVAQTSVSETIGSEATFESASSEYVVSTFDTTNNKVIVAYQDIGNSSRGTAVVGTVSGTSISFGTPSVFRGNNCQYIGIAFNANEGKCVISYRNATDQKGEAIVGTVSGTSISFGTAAIFNNADTEYTVAAYDAASQNVVIAYKDQANSSYSTAVVGVISGTSISFGSEVVFESTNSQPRSIVYDSGSSKVIIGYRKYDSFLKGFAVVGTVSGNGISFGTPVRFDTHNTSGYDLEYISLTYDSNANKTLFAYRGDLTYGQINVGTVSGTSISFGSVVNFHAANTQEIMSFYDPDTQLHGIAYEDVSNTDFEYVTATISGTSATISSPSTIDTAGVGTFTHTMGATYDTNANKGVLTYRNTSSYGVARVIQNGSTSTNLTSENYIGMSRGVVDVTSQTESIGSAVVYNNAGNTTKPHLCFDTSNNKVVIGFVDNALTEKGSAIVGTVSGTSISFGTKTAYEQSVTDFPAMVFDSSNNKVVVAYQDEGNSDYGTAAVGTVSGTSISFGTPVVFESAAVQHVSLAFDSNSNKVVISYSDHGNSEYGTAIVGTVSGTSISFGSATVFESAGTARVNSTFDSSNNKVVIAYRTSTGQAVVGTVSGTSISFGSPVQFKDELTDELDIVFDSNVNKVVIAYLNGAGSLGLAKVGTVSGTSISFGTEATFNSSGATYSISPVFDNSINKVVLLYQNAGNSNYGTSAVGTISGTDITFETPTVFASVNVGSAVGATFDSSNNKVVIAYRDGSNSNYGTSVVMLPGFTDITRGEVADGGNASVDIIGSVSDNQLSLTAGQQYFVQNDGTISTTADSPSVLAGTAISSTELLVKT